MTQEQLPGWLHASPALIEQSMGVETPPEKRDAAAYYLRQGVNAANYYAGGVKPPLVAVTSMVHMIVAAQHKASLTSLPQLDAHFKKREARGWGEALLTGTRLMARLKVQDDEARVLFTKPLVGGGSPVSAVADFMRDGQPYATLTLLQRGAEDAAVMSCERLHVLSSALQDERLLRRANDIARASHVRLYVWHDKRNAALPELRFISFLDTVYLWGAVIKRDYLHGSSLDLEVVRHFRQREAGLATQALLDNPPEGGGAVYIPALMARGCK